MTPLRAVLLLGLSGALLVGAALPGSCAPGGAAAGGARAPGTAGAASPDLDGRGEPSAAPPAGSGSAAPGSASAAPLVGGPSVAPPASASAAAPAAGAPARPLVIAALGDSLTDPKSNGGGYLDVVRARCAGSTVVNFGKGGNMVNQMRRRLLRDVLGPPPAERPAYTHLIVFGGVNDVLSNETARRTPGLVARDLSAIYAAARAEGLAVIALTLSPWGGFTSWFNPARHQFTLELNEWIRAAPARGEVEAVVDAWALLSCGVPTHLCAGWGHPFKDGLHFGPRAHQALGQALAEGPLGCGPPGPPPGENSPERP